HLRNAIDFGSIHRTVRFDDNAQRLWDQIYPLLEGWQPPQDNFVVTRQGPIQSSGEGEEKNAFLRVTTKLIPSLSLSLLLSLSISISYPWEDRDGVPYLPAGENDGNALSLAASLCSRNAPNLLRLATLYAALDLS